MDLRQLRVFIAAADALNFARAAESLGIAQPAVSQHIKTLEMDFGFQLFHRIRRGVELTPAGEAFLPEARAAVVQSERAFRIARRAHIGEVGQLHIGYVHSVMLEPELPQLIRRYRTAALDVTLKFSDISMNHYLDLLEDQALDVAFVRAPTGVLPRHLMARRFSSAPLMIALPSDHILATHAKIKLEALVDESFVLLQDPPGIGLGHQVLELCRTAGFTPKSEVMLQNLTIAVGLVAAGLGVCIIPAAIARTAPPGVTCRPLDLDEAISQVWMVHGAGALPPVCDQFLGLADWPPIVRFG